MPETPPKADATPPNPLEDFLTAAEAFVKNVSAAMLKAAGDHEDGVLIDGTSRVVIAQFASVCQEVRGSYRTTNAAARREVDKLLSIQQGALLARTGEDTAKAALSKGPGGGFFGWVSQYLEEIKKLIRFIVELIMGHMPSWLEKLLALIDELWDMISSLLSGVFGLKQIDVANEISARAVNTMNELAALARLEAARKGSRSDNGD
jgi:hypothetical protein